MPHPSQNILIAGAGYVGTALAQLLAAEGHHVTTLRRSPSSPAPNLTPLQANLVTGEGLDQLPANLHTIVYTAGADTFTEDAYRAAYVTGLQNLLAALASQSMPPRRLLFTSSTGVYAQDNGDLLDESSETLPTKFSGTILLEGEHIALASGIPATVVRFGGIYGPGRTHLINTVRNGTAYSLAGRTQYLNLIHRDDCVGVLRHLIFLDHPAPLYIAVDNTPTPRHELLNHIAQQLGVPAPPERDPTTSPDPQRGGNRRLSNAKLRATGYTLLHPDTRTAYAALIKETHA